MRDGRTLYLVKWRDLSYDQATWEEENENILGLKQAIDFYMVSELTLRNLFQSVFDKWTVKAVFAPAPQGMVSAASKECCVEHHNSQREHFGVLGVCILLPVYIQGYS